MWYLHHDLLIIIIIFLRYNLKLKDGHVNVILVGQYNIHGWVFKCDAEDWFCVMK